MLFERIVFSNNRLQIQNHWWSAKAFFPPTNKKKEPKSNLINENRKQKPEVETGWVFADSTKPEKTTRIRNQSCREEILEIKQTLRAIVTKILLYLNLRYKSNSSWFSFLSSRFSPFSVMLGEQDIREMTGEDDTATNKQSLIEINSFF